MNDVDLEEFNDSLMRCQSNPKFIDRFYELFLASSDEVRAKFAHTDFRKQRRMMKASLLMLMLAVDNKPEGRVHLERMAEVHGRTERAIPPHLYDVWLTCLVQAVKECDPHFNANTERVWRGVMENGIKYMKAHYETPAKSQHS